MQHRLGPCRTCRIFRVYVLFFPLFLRLFQPFRAPAAASQPHVAVQSRSGPRRRRSHPVCALAGPGHRLVACAAPLGYHPSCNARQRRKCDGRARGLAPLLRRAAGPRPARQRNTLQMRASALIPFHVAKSGREESGREEGKHTAWDSAVVIHDLSSVQ